MKTQTLGILVALVLGASDQVSAQGPMGWMMPPGDLSQYDLNGDGLVTRDEIAAARALNFQYGDTNRDGQLSLAEFQAVEEANQAARLQQEFDLLDADGDGGISLTEFQNGHPQESSALATRLYTYADSNADGRLTLTELAGLRSPEGRLWSQFASLDTDGSNTVSQTEFFAAPAGHPRMGGLRGL